jgi:hypothetical protein
MGSTLISAGATFAFLQDCHEKQIKRKRKNTGGGGFKNFHND